MSKTHNAGIVTAYGAAVRGGYTGTYEEFCAQQAEYAKNAREMEQAVRDVEDIKSSVESSVSEAENYANSASAAATRSSESATNASNYAISASQSANSASSSANTASQSAASAQTSANDAEEAEQSAQGYAQSAERSAESAAGLLANVYTKPEIDSEISKINGSLGTLGAFINTVPVDTSSGAVATFADGADNVPVKSLTVNIEPIQSGTGDPSPDNIRPISGWTGANLTCNNETINIDWTDEAGEVFGGTLDVISGKLTLDRSKITFNGSQSIGIANWRPYEDSSAWIYLPSVTPGIKNSKDVENLICDKLKSISYNSGVFVGSVGISLVGSKYSVDNGFY